MWLYSGSRVTRLVVQGSPEAGDILLGQNRQMQELPHSCWRWAGSEHWGPRPCRLPAEVLDGLSEPSRNAEKEVPEPVQRSRCFARVGEALSPKTRKSVEGQLVETGAAAARLQQVTCRSRFLSAPRASLEQIFIQK